MNSMWVLSLLIGSLVLSANCQTSSYVPVGTPLYSYPSGVCPSGTYERSCNDGTVCCLTSSTGYTCCTGSLNGDPNQCGGCVSATDKCSSGGCSNSIAKAATAVIIIAAVIPPAVVAIIIIIVIILICVRRSRVTGTTTTTETVIIQASPPPPQQQVVVEETTVVAPPAVQTYQPAYVSTQPSYGQPVYQPQAAQYPPPDFYQPAPNHTYTTTY